MASTVVARQCLPDGVADEQPEVPPVLQKLQKWADYESFGTLVAPTRFIPGKTPLAQDILDNWTLEEPPQYPHTVATLMAAAAAQGDRIGAFMDLANHACLYADDIPEHVEYMQVQLVAKQLPSFQAIDLVAHHAHAYWARHPDRAIAIHCAYGFNRTGFVVCCYLIQHAGLTVDGALAAFAAARPPGVKHETFIAELHHRYDPQPSAGPSLCTKTPMSHNQHPLPANNNENENSSSSSKNNNNNSSSSNTTTNDGGCHHQHAETMTQPHVLQPQTSQQTTPTPFAKSTLSTALHTQLGIRSSPSSPLPSSSQPMVVGLPEGGLQPQSTAGGTPCTPPITIATTTTTTTATPQHGVHGDVHRTYTNVHHTYEEAGVAEGVMADLFEASGPRQLSRKTSEGLARALTGDFLSSSPPRTSTRLSTLMRTSLSRHATAAALTGGGGVSAAATMGENTTPAATEKGAAAAAAAGVVTSTPFHPNTNTPLHPHNPHNPHNPRPAAQMQTHCSLISNESFVSALTRESVERALGVHIVEEARWEEVEEATAE